MYYCMFKKYLLLLKRRMDVMDIGKIATTKCDMYIRQVNVNKAFFFDDYSM